jgi:hypothetical protein
MERRISNLVNDHVNEYKVQLNNWIKKNNETLSSDMSQELIYLINNIKTLTLNKEDFMKRKRVKSVVAQYMRCIAKRANGEQCSRKKREHCKYCGTHEKNRPHGEITDIIESENNLTKIEVKLQEINGILYYIDNNNNIYCTEDIVSNIISPKIIGKYKIVENKYILIK